MAPVMSKVMKHWLLEEELILITSLACTVIEATKKKKRKHRWWVHELLKKRRQQGVYYNLMQELYLDDEKFIQYMRLSKGQFEKVLTLTGNDLVKYCRFREVICPRQRLALCLRNLATGESFRSIGFSYRVGFTTVGNIVSEVCQVLWKNLAPLHMQLPSTSEAWMQIAANFEEKWHFPHCLGALDGKHVVIKSPWNSGSCYFNYKGTFSIVLMALVDADLKFIAVDIGSPGRNSDGGIFANSKLGQAIAKDTLNFPNDVSLPRAKYLGPMPYVVIGDEAFPLQTHIMRPFPGRGCPEDERIFNYRLSRARRIVENTFGILAARWRIHHTKVAVRPTMVKDIVKATCVLHNMLQSQSTPAQKNRILQDEELAQPGGLTNIQRVGNRSSETAIEIRNLFKEYFCTVAPVPWQRDYVRRGLFTN